MNAKVSHSLIAAVAAVSLGTATKSLAAPVIVDVIPFNMNGETDWNAEPNIAVNPSNPNQVVISSFSDGGSHPYFITTNQTDWRLFDQLPHSDTSVDWSRGGTLYSTRLYSLGGNDAIDVQKSSNPTVQNVANTWRQNAPSVLNPGNLDQPWIKTDNIVGNFDHIYVSYNDLNNTPGSASIHQSLDNGVTWQQVVIDNAPVAGAVGGPFGVNGQTQDSAAVRVAPARIGTQVYAAFERWGSGANPLAQVVVVKDTLGGTLGYNGLGAAGTNVTRSFAANTGPLTVQVPMSLPDIATSGGTGLGANERLGSDVSLAVDPRDPNKVYVAWAQLIGGKSQIQVAVSTNGGTTFDLVNSLIPTDESALPSLAVADNGAVGLLYAAYEPSTGVNIPDTMAVRFRQVGSDLTGALDQVLTRFTDGDGAGPNPYVGDYFDLESVSNNFYGTFSAWNDPTAGDWPIVQPTYDRDPTLLGNSVPFSIDPFFFSTAAVPEPGSVAMFGVGGLAMAVRRRRKA